MSNSDETDDNEGVVRDENGKPRFRTIAVEKSGESGDE